MTDRTTSSALPSKPGLRRVVAPNPGPMTFEGTNTYLVGQGDVAVIDPGPDDPRHLSAILGALGPGEVIRAIVVTHPHRDHSALAPALAARTGAPVYGFGPPEAGRSPIMAELAAAGLAGGGEGVDDTFRPDRRLADGAAIELPAGRLEALWCPGHMASHLCLAWDGVLFSGDLIMAWATTLISPPDGDLAAFIESCRRLAGRGERPFLPGHGPAIRDGPARARELVAHREMRHAQIRAALGQGPVRLARLTEAIYPDLAPDLRPAAARNVFAHLIALAGDGALTVRPRLAPDALFELRR